ncbi:DUF952 domain-containing protein [Oceanirhabdus sp. W0125-5]|uniref:DUF952 domain-containing protein n=1 Tax=Oceanirhabdus sp. W0125-5 TaxID=2999116 RepID=UPI0022F30995|nr:DUF952 domain-containing protein [Oceanirhabdus sp. W0125-5]WBW97389.1 DUF952 domain-containing protein [Oceanirhabdus sp. W0125-5]
MIILHCVKKKNWDKVCNEKEYGYTDFKRNGFIHCSSIEYFWRVTEHFNEQDTEYVILCIDTDKVKAEIKWEDCDSNPGRYYPHIYGPIERNAIINVLPFLRDPNGNYIKNPEFNNIEDK